MSTVYDKKGRKYNQLTAEERGKIEAYRSEGRSIGEIAKRTNRAKSTIYNELKRLSRGVYQAKVAGEQAKEKRQKSHKHNKCTNPKLLEFIHSRLQKKYSPEIISVQLKSELNIKFSHTSIYRLIRDRHPEWAKYLICKGKKRNKLTHPAGQSKIPNRVDILKRDENINRRLRIGDWEADTVFSSRNGRSCLAVFVNRKTRLYLIEKMQDKSADQMVAATVRALKNSPVDSITYDNGTENVKHQEINNILNCKSFFCHPYCSNEKGSIENRNKILRQFLPKGTNFDLISEEEIRKIQNEINERPMKCLGWRSPLEVSKASFGLLV